MPRKAPEPESAPVAPLRPTAETCAQCAPFGLVEYLWSNGTMTRCTQPWCGYDRIEPGEQGAAVESTQIALF